MASLRFKKDGTPFVDFRVQGHRFRPEFPSLKEAQKFYPLADKSPIDAYRLWQDSIVEQPISAVDNDFISLREKIESFKNDYCSKRVNSNDMRREMTRFFDFVLARANEGRPVKADDIDVRALTLEDFAAYQTHLSARGLSGGSVNRYFTTIKTFNRRALKAQYIGVDYTSLIDGLSVEKVSRAIWQDGDTSKLLKALGADADPVLTEIGKSLDFTPFGPKDFSRLKWHMVNIEVGEIRTHRFKGKGKRRWNVPLFLGFQKLLIEIKKRRDASGFGEPNDYVFVDQNGKPVKPAWISKSFERARKKVGIVANPYTSRHRILNLVAEKTDRDTASVFAGHASVRTTEQHYLTTGDDNFRRKVREAFAE